MFGQSLDPDVLSRRGRRRAGRRPVPRGRQHTDGRARSLALRRRGPRWRTAGDRQPRPDTLRPDRDSHDPGADQRGSPGDRRRPARPSARPGAGHAAAATGLTPAQPRCQETHGTTVTGHFPARTSRTASDPTNRCPACADAPTTIASARTSSAMRQISVYGSPRAARNVIEMPSSDADRSEPAAPCPRTLARNASSLATVSAAPPGPAAPKRGQRRHEHRDDPRPLPARQARPRTSRPGWTSSSRRRRRG